MNLKDAGLDVATLAALHEVIGDALKAARAEAQDALKAEKARTGTRQITVDLPGGETVATITLVTPNPVAVVVDEAEFLTWAIKHCPSEIERRFVTEVRPAFLKALLKETSAAGAPRWCDKTTGVIHDVPGVKLQGRAPYPRLEFTDTGREDVARAWRAGELAHVVLPELAPGGED